MSKYKLLKDKIILNKKIKIYTKKNSKKLYCKLKTRTKTGYKNKMVSIKDYKKYYNKKMKGGVKKRPKSKTKKTKKSFNPFAVKESIREKFGTQMLVFKPKKFKISSTVPRKSAFNNSEFRRHMDLENTARNITWGPTQIRTFDNYPLRRVTAISINNVSPYPELRYSAGFAPRRRTHFRIPHRGPTLQQKRNREIARQRAFDHELKRAREERINLNSGLKHRPIQRPYNHEAQRRRLLIKNRGY
tara:strand:+ start:738 stop:1472 length:735 start_codon:yes stop_codon:yes gene_type:complete